MSEQQQFPPGSPDEGLTATATETSAEAFAGLVAVVEDFRSVLAQTRAGEGQADPRQVAELRLAENRIRDCLHALGWVHCPDNGGPRPVAVPAPSSWPEAGPGTAVSPAWEREAARRLAHLVDAAQRDCTALLGRLERSGHRTGTDQLRVARRCQGLLEDALLLGAMDLAVRLGAPDDQLPR